MSDESVVSIKQQDEIYQLLEYFVNSFKRINNNLRYIPHGDDYRWRPMNASTMWVHVGVGIIIEGGSLMFPLLLSITDGHVRINKSKILDDFISVSDEDTITEAIFYLEDPRSLDYINEYMLKLLKTL